MNKSKSPALRAVLFDMDGTLTVPMLDFPRIKAEMGIGGRPILEALAEMREDERLVAEAILCRHETIAAQHSTLNHGCVALLDWLAERRIATAVVTRNSFVSAQHVMSRHNLSFAAMVTREFGRFKPDPAPLLEACRLLGVSPTDAWMVGDGQYDVEAGVAAGMKTVWLSHGRRRAFDAEPWREAIDLPAVLTMLRDALTSTPSACP